jgi:ribosomal 30S subunit maturation factor RimM
VDKYTEFGKIVGIHGLKGEMLLDCFFTNFNHFVSKGIFMKFEDGFNQISIKKNGIKKLGVIIHIEGCNSKEDTVKFLNKTLFTPRDALEELDDGDKNTHFVADLLNLEVKVDGEEGIFGNIHDVVNFGGGPLLEVKLEHSHKFNKNKTEKFEYYEKNITNIKEVNLKQGYLILNYEIF